MSNDLKIIGKQFGGYTGRRKVTGTAKYSNDYSFPNAYHGKTLRSPYAHAKIVDIDASEAEKIEGVKLIMSYKNFPTYYYDSVHYHGMDVACVIATTKRIATEAIKFIKVEYEELPFVTSGKEAMEENAPQALNDKPNVSPFDDHQYFSQKNDKGHYTNRMLHEFDGFGDIDTGYSDSDLVVEDNGYAFGFVKTPLMKPTTCLADYNDKVLNMYFDNQQPYITRNELAAWLELPVNRVRILSEINSCSFGGRTGGATETCMTGASCSLNAAVASIALNHPVSMEYSLDEDQLYYWGRGTFDSRVALGFKKDGTMVMTDSEVWRNAATGGYTGEATQGNDINGVGHMLYSHNCEHAKHVKHRIYTNSPGWTGWQAFGNPEVFFPVQCVMDIAAEELGIDPVDLQKMNIIRKGDNYLSATYNWTGPQYLGRDGLMPCIEAGIKATDWYNKRKLPHEKTGIIRHGMGMSPAIMQNGGQSLVSQAIVTLNSDGTALLYCNYQDIGQGGHGTQVQIVAEVLDIPFENVRIRAGDTDSPYTTLQIASSGTVTQGRATYNAAMDARTKLINKASEMTGVAVNLLDMKNGRVYNTADPDMEIPWMSPLMTTVANFDSHEISWMGTNVYDVLGYGTSYVGTGATSSELGATFVDLDVDTETGEISNVKIFHAQDCGKAINPKAVEGNILTIHHGLEAMTGAEQILDKKTGKLLNDSWIDYACSTALDSEVTPHIIEVFDPTHPYGAAGVGQAVMNSIPGAFANAVYNVIGVRIKTLPITPAKILKALKEKNEKNNSEMGAT